MTSAAYLLDQPRAVRAMVVGGPGAGKTGGAACLLDAGFKIRLMSYDRAWAPLIEYTKDKSKLANLDICLLKDQIRHGPKSIETVGIPSAFTTAFKLMDHWKYKDPITGEDVDLGKPKDWGPDTIIMLDNLTDMGEAARRWAHSVGNRTYLNARDSDWGFAMSEQDALMEKMATDPARFHVMVLAHTKMVGPKDLRKGDDDLTVELKERAAALVETRLYPSALGQVLPPLIARHFPTLLECAAVKKQGKTRRVVRHVPRPELDLKIPVPDLPEEMSIEDGYLRVFEALTGGVQNCLNSATVATE